MSVLGSVSRAIKFQLVAKILHQLYCHALRCTWRGKTLIQHPAQIKQGSCWLPANMVRCIRNTVCSDETGMPANVVITVL